MAASKRAGSSEPTSTILLRKAPLILILLGWLFVFLSMVGFDAADPPTHSVWPVNEHISNWCGLVGAWTSHHLFRMFGFGAWLGVFVSGLIILAAASGQLVRHVVVRGFGLIMMVAAIGGLQHLLFPHSSRAFPDLSGGVLGTVGCETLSRYFGPIGAGIWLGAMLLIGTVVCMDDWLAISWLWSRKYVAPVAMPVASAAGGAAMAVGGAAARRATEAGTGMFDALAEMIKARKPVEVKARANDVDDDQPALAGIREGQDKAVAKLAKVPKPRVRLKVNKEGESEGTEPAVPLDIADPDDPANNPLAKETPAKKSRKKKMEEPEEDEDGETEPHSESGGTPEGAEEEEEETDVAVAVVEAQRGPKPMDETALREKIAQLPMVFGQQNKQIASDADLRDVQNVTDEENYRFPGLDLLENPEANFNDLLKGYVQEQAVTLEAALQQYKISGEVVGIESGPVVTLYDVKLAAGTKVALLQTVSNDLARAMKAPNIRIVPVQSGRDTVGIEVPNAQKEKVRMKELMGRTEVFSAMKLPMFLGKDASGQPLIADLASMPHMLIAGTTGSGKSVCMNTILTGFLYTKKPSELKLVLVDPKMVELSQFKDIPHLMCPVVTDMNKAAAILEWAVQKMDERYELLAEAGCQNIAAYNGLPWEELKERFNASSPEEESRIPRKLPYMVFMIDELADLMLTNKEVETSIIRIAQKARAVGIHLILATQRPQANVVTGLIKGNMPCRMCFKVASGLDSRIVLDQKGGELLLGHGDMLFLNPKTSKTSRAQGTLVDDGEIRRVVKFMKEVAKPTFDRNLIHMKKAGEEPGGTQNLVSENNSSAALAAAQEDPMFEKAVEIVLETKRGSVSLLQRRLGIGYTRSSRLIDLMGIAGIIGEHKGSQARDIAITAEDWTRMKELATQEATGKGMSWPVIANPQAQLFDADAKEDQDPPPWEENTKVAETPFFDEAESLKKEKAEKAARREANKPKDALAANKGFDPDNDFDPDDE